MASVAPFCDRRVSIINSGRVEKSQKPVAEVCKPADGPPMLEGYHATRCIICCQSLEEGLSYSKVACIISSFVRPTVPSVKLVLKLHVAYGLSIGTSFS